MLHLSTPEQLSQSNKEMSMLARLRIYRHKIRQAPLWIRTQQDFQDTRHPEQYLPGRDCPSVSSLPSQKPPIGSTPHLDALHLPCRYPWIHGLLLIDLQQRGSPTSIHRRSRYPEHSCGNGRLCGLHSLVGHERALGPSSAGASRDRRLHVMSPMQLENMMTCDAMALVQCHIFCLKLCVMCRPHSKP